MEKLFKSEIKVSKFIQESEYKIDYEQEFILNFFKSLPIDYLKRLINFKVIDFEDETLWADPKMFEILTRLKSEDSIKLNCELLLDDGTNLNYSDYV